MRTPPNDSAPKPPLSPAEQAALQALKEARETGTRLIPKGLEKPTKKRFGKPKAGGSKPSVIKPKRPSKPKADGPPSAIKPERWEPKRAAAEVQQALGKGRSRAVTVEFAAQTRSSRQKPG